MRKTITTLLAAMAVAALMAAPAAAKGKPADAPDTACMQAGIATLKSIDAFSAVAKDGLAIETAVSVGVTVRPGADISMVPNPIPLSIVLADHRAGDNSLFVYPWCD
jgi:hypothetical protein